MKRVKFVFVVLTFRTGQDMPSFIDSISSVVDDYKVVVVNSYYNDESLNEIREIALSNHCDFIPIENKGYGYGNNKGIEYAQQNYDYDYLVVCNADIKVQSADFDSLCPNALNAPIIKTITGKMQNPYWVHKNRFIEWLIYRGHKKHSRLYMVLGQGLNRVFREVFLFLFLQGKKPQANIYAAHGSFLIFPKEVIQQLFPIFDENMFLYYEEAYLANKLRNNSIDIILHKNISILHYEDGSTKGSNLDLSSYASKSYLYYYEMFIKK